MTDKVPLSRPLRVDDLPAEGLEVTVQPTASEREALAKEFGIVSVDSLEGRFLVQPRSRGAVVTGAVHATVHQTCVVSLEDFEVHITEPVDVRFSRDVEPPRPGEAQEGTPDQPDPPDPIVNGRIDLGVLTAEFLSLGIDPYPRKPGVVFEGHGEEDTESPFAALSRLRKGPKP